MLGVLILPGAFLSREWLQRNAVDRTQNGARWMAEKLTYMKRSPRTRLVAEALTWIALWMLTVLAFGWLLVVARGITWTEAFFASFLIISIVFGPVVLTLLVAALVGGEGTLVLRLELWFGWLGVFTLRLVTLMCQGSLYGCSWLLSTYAGSKVRAALLGGILILAGLILQLFGTIIE